MVTARWTTVNPLTNNAARRYLRTMRNANEWKTARCLVAVQGSTSLGATLARRGFDSPAFRSFAALSNVAPRGLKLKVVRWPTS